MIVFDFFMTFIEDYILSYYSLKITHTSHKFYHTLLITFICILETFLLNYTFLNNFILLISLIVTQYASIFLIKHKHNMYHLIVPIMIMTCLSTSNIISLLLTSFLFQQNVMHISSQNYLFALACIISRLIYLTLCILIDKSETQFDVIIFEKYNWISFMILSLSINIFIAMLCELIVYNKVDIHTIHYLMMLSFVIVISLFYFYFKTKTNYRIYIETSNQLLKEEYSKEILNKTKDLSYRILLDKHEMYYNLLHIQDYIMNQKDDEALTFIEQKIHKYKAYELSQLTHHPIFDYQILGYINELKQQGYDIKPVIACGHEDFFDRTNIIDFMKEAIDSFVEYTKESKRFELYLYEKNSVLILKISADKQERELKEFDVKDRDYIAQMEVIENSIGETELRVLFK